MPKKPYYLKDITEYPKLREDKQGARYMLADYNARVKGFFRTEKEATDYAFRKYKRKIEQV